MLDEPVRPGAAGRAAYPNGIYVNYAKEVDLSSGVRAARANDGEQHGFYGQDSVAVTDVEDSPWLRVDLGQLREASALSSIRSSYPWSIPPRRAGESAPPG